ncbi:hypothetical protein [Streptomyces yangpuensis]
MTSDTITVTLAMQRTRTVALFAATLQSLVGPIGKATPSPSRSSY